MGDEAGVVWVTDYDSGNSFGAAIGMECVGYSSSSSREGKTRGGQDLFSNTFFLDVLPLTGFRTLRNSLAEHGHELTITGKKSRPAGANS